MLLQLPPILLLKLLFRLPAAATAEAAAATSSQLSADLLLPNDVRRPPELPPAYTQDTAEHMDSATRLQLITAPHHLFLADCRVHVP